MDFITKAHFKVDMDGARDDETPQKDMIWGVKNALILECVPGSFTKIKVTIDQKVGHKSSKACTILSKECCWNPELADFIL